MAKPIARASAPIWTRPARVARSPRLSRDQIAVTALAIADAEGFDAVSMRRVAAELDVGTMTLYYYVKTKDDLVALMDDAITGEVVLPAEQLPRGWRAGLTAIARISRAVFARHPWALYSLQGARIGPNGMRHMEQSLAAISELPLDLKGKLAILSIVDDYVFGHVLRVTEGWTHPMDHKVLTAISEFFTTQLATGEFPHLEAMVGGEDVLAVFSRFARWMSEDARFEAGLTAILDGLELSMRAAAPGEPVTRPASGPGRDKIAPWLHPSRVPGAADAPRTPALEAEVGRTQRRRARTRRRRARSRRVQR
jgi:AcrR family transcriptional regulator